MSRHQVAFAVLSVVLAFSTLSAQETQGKGWNRQGSMSGGGKDGNQRGMAQDGGQRVRFRQELRERLIKPISQYPDEVIAAIFVVSQDTEALNGTIESTNQEWIAARDFLGKNTDILPILKSNPQTTAWLGRFANRNPEAAWQAIDTLRSGGTLLSVDDLKAGANAASSNPPAAKDSAASWASAGDTAGAAPVDGAPKEEKPTAAISATAAENSETKAPAPATEHAAEAESGKTWAHDAAKGEWSAALKKGSEEAKSLTESSFARKTAADTALSIASMDADSLEATMRDAQGATAEVFAASEPSMGQRGGGPRGERGERRQRGESQEGGGTTDQGTSERTP